MKKSISQETRLRNYKNRLWIQAIFDQIGFLILPHPLTNFEIQKYYQNEPRLNGVYSRDNLPNKIKDEAHVINLDGYSDIGSHWIALYTLDNNVTCFDISAVKHILKEI